VDALEKVHNCIMARCNVSRSLTVECQRCVIRNLERLTPRRTPIPVKIVLAGENGYESDDVREQSYRRD
jgi:hypothetical protein